jgi:oligopeptide/dipeptide ABC transporter ATP-binding protein
LLKSLPKIGERTSKGRRRLQEISGNVPNPFELPTGCSFHPRCPNVMSICREKIPELFRPRTGRSIRCWLYAE